MKRIKVKEKVLVIRKNKIYENKKNRKNINSSFLLKLINFKETNPKETRNPK